MYSKTNFHYLELIIRYVFLINNSILVLVKYYLYVVSSPEIHIINGLLYSYPYSYHLYSLYIFILLINSLETLKNILLSFLVSIAWLLMTVVMLADPNNFILEIPLRYIYINIYICNYLNLVLNLYLSNQI